MRRASAALLAVVAVLLARPAHALPDWVNMIDFSGYIQSDVRFEIENYRGATPGQGYDFQMNLTDVDARLEIKPHPAVVAVVDTRLRYYGFVSSQTLAVANLWNASAVDPFTVYLDQAYGAVHGVPFRWLDIKAGRMQQSWGAVDVFSPTDNLNAHDFSDPLTFVRKVPNEMVELDAYPTDWFTINMVWLPVFQPSMLPPSAPLAFAIHENSAGCLTQFPAPPLTTSQMQQLESLFQTVNPCQLNFSSPTVNTYLPSNGIADSQAAIRGRFKADLGETGGDLDIDLSYYYGRFTFPIAYDAAVSVTPGAGKTAVAYGAEVTYPLMQVAGFDFSYNAPWLAGIGLVGSLAVIFPQQVDFALGVYNGGSNILTLSNVNVPNKPFVKASAGAEWAPTQWLYLNVLYIHGFVDEFNDQYGLHDYVALTPMVKLAHDTVHITCPVILDATDLSNVEYPQLGWTLLPGIEATLGAFWLGGPVNPTNPLSYASRSKFGQYAAGRSVAFLRVKTTW